jgi:hypothetical protein
MEMKTIPFVQTPNTNFILVLKEESQDKTQQLAKFETKTDKDKCDKVKTITGINTSHLCSGHPIYCISQSLIVQV